MQRDKKKEYSVIRGQAACLRLTLQRNPNSECMHRENNNSLLLARLINAEVYGYGSRNICLLHHLPMAPLRLKSWMELMAAVMQAPAFRGKR